MFDLHAYVSTSWFDDLKNSIKNSLVTEEKKIRSIATSLLTMIQFEWRWLTRMKSERESVCVREREREYVCSCFIIVNQRTKKKKRDIMYDVLSTSLRRIKEYEEIRDKQKKCIDFFFYLQASRRLDYKS